MSKQSRVCVAGLLPVLATVLSLAGCRNEVDDTYGRRSGVGAESVNGTAVLGDMFQRAGHTVYSRSALAPRIREKAQCIVWFPNDQDPPTEDVRHWLADWLSAAPDRTLIYVGRDFDAWPFYWKKIGKPVPPGGAAPWRIAKLKKEKKAPEKKGEKEAKDESPVEPFVDSLEDEDSWDDPDDEPNQWDAKDGPAWEPWFTLDANAKLRTVQTLQGEPEWTEGIDPKGLEIELRVRMIPAEETETLLKSEADLLVGRLDAGRGQVLLVANGSFLLNVPLVNHEHRKLAGKLIDAVGPPGQTVVFLESGPGGPPIREEDPKARTPSAFDILLEHPYFWIFLHVVFACTLYGFARWPIFGLARELPLPPASDFGRHIEAMAELLRRSRDRTFAYAKLLGYRQKAEDKRRATDKPQT